MNGANSPTTEIIGYVEPWIVSPGETIDVKVGTSFLVLGTLG